MIKTKRSTTQAAPKSSAKPSFLEVLTSDPEFKRMNPHVKFVDGKFVDVPVEPRKVVPLRDPGGKHRAAAMREAILQMEEIFNELIDRVKDDDTITFALVTRCHDLNNALMNRMDDQISTRELKGLVYHGEPLTHDDDQIEIESPVSKSAKSKAGRSERKVAAAA